MTTTQPTSVLNNTTRKYFSDNRLKSTFNLKFGIGGVVMLCYLASRIFYFQTFAKIFFSAVESMSNIIVYGDKDQHHHAKEIFILYLTIS
jgi:hypothetical protein